jgi:hypothetical protein
MPLDILVHAATLAPHYPASGISPHLLADGIADHDDTHRAEKEPALMHDRRVFGSILLIGLFVIALVGAAYAQPAPANEVFTWNRIARVVAQERGLDAWDSARLLALLNLAMTDSYIAGFEIRYLYDSWRPVTAIREGDIDGNDATAGDPRWNSLQNTPNVSDYPSTQSTFSGAAAAALAGGLGTDDARFRVTSGAPLPDITRAFTGFAQAARESADPRVYAGIHFRTACEDGLVLGRKIGERVVALYLQPVKK